ncbi:MAG TPA: hypothetical protein DCE41_11270 [Cytophagales bacterium]|nr:hypothetical protein [Cytophagales bacterium]HAA24220.1 hypothetical protein [Cytophagales bacterium]HAP64412.1 hypothetical protein [Cytophagales bacterium]
MKTNLTLNHPVNENLFRLIHSLEKSEKRHVKMWLQSTYKKEEQRYTFLFDYLDRQKKYREEALITKLQGLYSISRHQVATTKYLLYHIILRSLRHLYANHHASFKIREGLDTVELLFEKKLYVQCLRMLERVKQQAVQEEQTQYFPLIVEWERRIFPFLNTYYHEAEVLNLQASTQQMADQFELATRIDQEYYRSELLKFQNVNTVRQEEQEKRLQWVADLAHAMGKCTVPMTSQRVKLSRIENRYAQWWSDADRDTKVTRDLTYLPTPKQLPVSQLGEIQRAFLELLPTISNSTTLQQSLHYLDNLPVAAPQEANHTLVRSLIRWHMSMIDPRVKAEVLCQQFTDTLPDLPFSAFDGHLACEWQVRLALDNWIIGKPKKALKLLNHLTQQHKHPLGIYQSDRVRLVTLLLLVDLDETGVVEYLLRSTERGLHNREYDTSAFQQLLKCLKRLFFAYSPKEKEAGLEELAQASALGQPQTYHDVYWGTGIFQVWAKHKLNQSAMLEAFRQVCQPREVAKDWVVNAKVAS